MKSRVENILQAIIDGTSSSTLPPAQSRNEMLLIQVLNKVNELAAAASKSHVHICSNSEYNHETGVPTVSNPDADVLYLVPNSGSGTDIYAEWIYANDAWEQVGSASVGLVSDVQVNGTSVVTDSVAEISLPKTETVTGSTPSITGVADTRYVCGECSTLAITTPSTGIIDVVFTSGSTATVLTVTPPTGMTMKWANEFDPTSLSANTTYEINIMDGMYGVVASWA